MRYTLRDYQRQAAVEVLERLERSRTNLHRYCTRSAFSLTALTGAGKTVIATAVLEAVLWGSADLETSPDPRAVFLWVTDDPALNRQTVERILQASDSITASQLVVIDEQFDQPTLAPGHVYFLNTQKLGSRTSYVTGGTDSRETSLWDTVVATAASADMDLVLVLDEAHRGMKSNGDRKTLVRRLIDGQTPRAGRDTSAPIVWGISATTDRFEAAMAGTQNRDRISPVVVDIELVRASGLVKQHVVVAEPAESGYFDATLLRDAVNTLAQMDTRWLAHTRANGLEPVDPAMVIQVPDNASDAKIGEIIEAVANRWPTPLPDRAFAHVLGEHTDRTAAGRTLRYVRPERIEDDHDIRFVIAKEAITTGWDCPRAEVLYSERGGKDETHIAQLIGRIVRSPLARAIEDDQHLNLVFAYLPGFDEDAVSRVIARLDSGDDAVAGQAVRRTADFDRVADAESFELLATTPCVPAPATLSSPLRRAKALAVHLAGDGFCEGAVAELQCRLNSRLDGLAAEHATQVWVNAADIASAEIRLTSYGYGGGTDETNVQRTVRSSRTDTANIEDAYRQLARKLKEGVAEDWRRHLAAAVEAEGDEVDMVEVKSRVAGLLMIEGVIDQVEAAAEQWSKDRLDQFRVAIRALTEVRRAVYLESQGQASTPERVELVLPGKATVPVQDIQGQTVPGYLGHVYAGVDRRFPARLNDWETQVVATETARCDFVGWYRNPSTASKAAVRIAYKDGEVWKSLQPDFIVLSRLADGTLVRSIIDPHGAHLADAAVKLRALANYAETYADELYRVEALSKVDEVLQVLDLTDPKTRQAVREHADNESVEALYAGPLAHPYS